jgi:hypothetical protein
MIEEAISEAQTSAIETLEPRVLVQHSNASADWGTPELGRRFAACVLRPAAMTEAIDLDYASSKYWNTYWPDKTRPAAYLDGSSGRDVLIEADRRSALTGTKCGAGFLNAPGLLGGAMVQRCWEVFEADHRSGWLGSGVWWGYSLEQFASLQGVGERNPLTVGVDSLITTVVPSRRARYVLHPEAYIALLLKKQSKRVAGSKEWQVEQRLLDTLRARNDDSPVTPPAPPHASYITILWHRDKAVRRRQMAAAQQFLKTQAEQPKSLLQKVAIVGEMTL